MIFINYLFLIKYLNHNLKAKVVKKKWTNFLIVKNKLINHQTHMLLLKQGINNFNLNKITIKHVFKKI